MGHSVHKSKHQSNIPKYRGIGRTNKCNKVKENDGFDILGFNWNNTGLIT